MVLDLIRQQVDALRRPLAAVTLTTLPRRSSPLLLLLHWHGFVIDERRRAPPGDPEHPRAAAVPSSALQMNQPWVALEQIDAQMLDAAWQLGAWELRREERRGCNWVGASAREALECRQAFGDNPLAPDDEAHLVAEAPDRAEMRDLAARIGYVRWLFRPVADGLWQGAGPDDSLSGEGRRAPPCPVEPAPALGRNRRYQLGRIDRIARL